MMKCPECGSKKIEINMKETCCLKCGLVIDENLTL
jgi:transcription initiation factor TFIIIB Brf1 subunit/transcription initiation factor TFIIB